MKQKKNSDSFWASYVDVMTNLFAITLVLFVVSFFWYRHQNGELVVIKKEYDKIKELKSAINQLNNNDYFKYNEHYQKHVLCNVDIEFIEGYDRYRIPEDLSLKCRNDETMSRIDSVGISIIKTITTLKDEYERNQNSYRIKFLVVIEGQASRSGDIQRNYELSYRRALSLMNHWRNDNVKCGEIRLVPDTTNYNQDLNCEIIVSGSGVHGVPREDESLGSNPKNQRFLVHIVPIIEWINDEHPSK